jgi:transposase
MISSKPPRELWIAATLVEREYFTLRQKERGKVRSLLSKLSGLSMPQVTRWIRRYRADGEIAVRSSLRQRFPVKYTVKDLELLIDVDRAHQQLGGPATRRIVEREWHVFGRREYANLAEISGGAKGLWFSHTKPDDRRLVLTEGAIDALSHATLFPDAADQPRYASLGGKPAPNNRAWSRRPSRGCRKGPKSWRRSMPTQRGASWWSWSVWLWRPLPPRPEVGA